MRELSHLEQLETLSDPDRHPREWQLATALPRPRPARRRPGAAGRHRLASGRRAAADGVRPPGRSRSPAASGCARSSRTRTSASRSRRRRSRSRSCATSTRPRSGTTSRRRTSSACSLRRGVLEPTGERREPGPQPAGGPRALFRFRSRGARDHGPVRSAAAARTLSGAPLGAPLDQSSVALVSACRPPA